MNDLWRLRHRMYKGLLMYCPPGLHEKLFSILFHHVTPCGPVLDLAAGTGAWLSRLMDAGFKDFSAVDLNVNKFKFDGIHAFSIDLNSDFSNKFSGKFKIVSAIEIIEHLDNPRNFLNQIHSLLQDNGYLLLSTPNINHWISRLRFLLQGQLRYFQESHYHNQGHISPVTDLQMRLMFDEIGFRLVEYSTAGSFFGPLQKLVTAPVSIPFRLMFGPYITGDANIYLTCKS